MKKVLLLALTALSLAGAGLWWFGPAARARAVERYPQIVLVTLDTLHVLHTGLFDREVADTPNLDALAGEGVHFAQARTTVPMTLPSHASLLSGRTPLGMGLLRNGEKVADDVRTLPQALGEVGYRTAAFVSLATLRRDYLLDRGFEVYSDGYESVPRFYRTADEVLDEALPWLEQHRDEPFFLWVHLSDPHEPYGLKGAPPDTRIELDGDEIALVNLASKETVSLELELEPGRHQLRWISLREPAPDDLPGTGLYVRFRQNENLLDYVASWEQLPRPDASLEEPLELDLVRTEEMPAKFTVRFDGRLRKPPPSVALGGYAEEVAYADAHLGMLREAVERDGRPTLWIVASDHGEGLYHHRDVVGHAGFNREDQLRIVWAMSGPGLARGVRVETPVLIHDIAPTALELIGLRDLPAAEGRSRLDCARGGECGDDAPWFAHGFSERHDRLSAVTAYRWPFKAISQLAPGSGTYDLAADPWEQKDLSRVEDGSTEFTARRLQRDITEVRELLERRVAEGGGDLSEEDLELLRSLGYIGN